MTLPCQQWQQWTLSTKAAVERKEKKRKEKKRRGEERRGEERRGKERKDYAFRHQFSEKSSIIPGCPGGSGCHQEPKPRLDIVFEMRLFEVTNNLTLAGVRVSIAAFNEEQASI